MNVISMIMEPIPVSRLRFQIISDIHLELRTAPPPIQVAAEILALCGDIGYPQTDIYQSFIKWASEHYELVLLIAGNHEYYSKKVPLQEMNDLIREISKRHRNVVFLESEWRLLECQNAVIRVFGAVMWTDLRNHPSIKHLITDYSKITIITNLPGEKRTRYPITPGDTSAIHLKTVATLEELLKEDVPTIVLSHHLPSGLCTPHHDEYTPAYASNLERLLQAPVVLWACGHSHSSIDMKINGVRIISNQLGYPFETGTGYKEIMSIDVQELIKTPTELEEPY